MWARFRPVARSALFLTLVEAGPYPVCIRTITAITCLALTGCATDVVSRAEHADVLSSVRALRAENARLESRLEKLEAQQLLLSTRAAQVKTSTTQSSPAVATRREVAPSSIPMDAIPPLAVVKLKPKREPPPKISTAIEVSEPSEAVVEEAQANEPSEDEQAMAQLQFDRGLEMMKTGNSEAGLRQLQQFSTDWPRHPRADNAIYFVGLAWLSQKEYQRASDQFERVLSTYPAGDAVLDSMLKLADCRLKLNRGGEARATWQKIVSTFPGTTAATEAQSRLNSSSVP